MTSSQRSRAASPRLDVDLRSEVVARPTEAMFEAMRTADVRWSPFEPDPYVVELEERLAALAGTEASLFVATGSVGNILGVLALSRRGSQVVLERRSHIHWAEGNSATLVANVSPRLVEGGRFGNIAPETLREALDEARGFGQLPSLVCVENSHNVCGGTTTSPSAMSALTALARERGVRVFVDGARLWNAAATHGVSLAELLHGADGAMISLNKALGAPFGAVLVGGRELVERARRDLKVVGAAGMHRMGYFAAAALVALDTMVERIPEDHRRAKILAEGLHGLDGLAVDLDTVQTNLVRIQVTAPGLDAAGYVERLREAGIGARVVEPPRAVKFNLHWEIDDTAVLAVVDASRAILERSVP
jgi:threonine aldolase